MSNAQIARQRMPDAILFITSLFKLDPDLLFPFLNLSKYNFSRELEGTEVRLKSAKKRRALPPKKRKFCQIKLK